MGRVPTAALAGSIVRRVREDSGISRAELAQKSGVGSRTLYALETGESENFGLGSFLRVLDALGLSMSVDYDCVPNAPGRRQANERRTVPWDDLADIWKIDGDENQ